MSTTKPIKIAGSIANNEQISHDTTELTIKGDFPTYQAGQFCFLSTVHEGKSYKRAYSIVSSPQETDIKLCIKAHREASTIFTQLQTGAAVEVFMPFGHFTIPAGDAPLVMIATGTGVAPYKSMIASLEEKRHASLLVGNKTAMDQLYHEHWRSLAKRRENFKYYPTLSRETQEDCLQGYVQDHLEKAMTQDAEYLICGVNAMVEDVERLLRGKGIDAAKIHYEKYG